MAAHSEKTEGHLAKTDKGKEMRNWIRNNSKGRRQLNKSMTTDDKEGQKDMKLKRDSCI